MKTLHGFGKLNSGLIRLRTLGVSEVNRMMRKASLTVESVWGDLDSSPLTIDSKRMLTLAVKQSG